MVHAMLGEMLLGTVVSAVDPFIDAPFEALPCPLGRSESDARTAIRCASHFVVAIGGPHGHARLRVAASLEAQGLRPLSVIHPSASIDESVTVGDGALVMPGVVVNKFGTIGSQAVLNTGCVIDHEASIGDGVHVMGSAALAGRVCLGDAVTIGTNATVLPDVRIGAGSYVGAGAVVLRDVARDTVVAGVPARRLRRTTHTVHSEILDALDSRLP